MALDGSTWDEANPQQSTLANQIDSYERDIKQGVRVRMATEHVWPASQTGSSEAGYHTYVSFQNQTATPFMPIVTGLTQGGMLFVSTGALIYQNSDGTLTTMANSAGGVPVSVANIIASTANTVLVSGASTPKWTGIGSIFAVTSGQAGHGDTIASAAGFASAECTVFVSLADDNPANTTWDWDEVGNHMHMRHQVSVNASRVVTCVMTVNNNSDVLVTITGTVNYLLYAVKDGA